ncbi:MAG: hypothetical protein L6Q29_03630 [Candidatus Pacebacteria bacterium]|nr:hypothetical protein [Candidatus Paceibacterota bacterium]NUQ57498.1 hypothetical protein [Candidatus Paceibacter sp.]
MKITRTSENEFEIEHEPLIEKGSIENLKEKIKILENEKDVFEEKFQKIFKEKEERELKIEELKNQIEEIKKLKINDTR